MNDKVPITKELFAEALLLNLEVYIKNKYVKQVARMTNYKIKGIIRTDIESFNRLCGELILLCLYFVVDICDSMFDEEEKKNEVLDILHDKVYERLFKDNTNLTIPNWKKLTVVRYSRYSKAHENSHKCGSYQPLEREFRKNLFSKPKEHYDVVKSLQFQSCISLIIQQLIKSVKKFMTRLRYRDAQRVSPVKLSFFCLVRSRRLLIIYTRRG